MMKDPTLDLLFPSDPAASVLGLTADLVLQRLDDLRKETADLAFVLETSGRIDAADVANMMGARLAELHEELTRG
jgi:hypothetical protein